jgi:hypothetical protein
MKTTLPFLIASLALGLTISLSSATLFAQGTLTPPGGPAPTMRTLTQIEPRTPISSAPVTLNASGSYYLTTNLTVSGGDAITIVTNGVTLDLNGFTITSTDPGATGFGIRLHSGSHDLAILNGHVQGGVTNNAGIYSGPGFGHGVGFDSPPLVNVRVVGVSVSGCRYNGIALGSDDATVVEGCTVRTVGSVGIVASTIKNSVALGCGSSGIYGRQVSDSRGESLYSGSGLFAETAQNCYGSSVSGFGLYVTSTALNCYGLSVSGLGLYADLSATGCQGKSSSGTGLFANTAQNCHGSSNSGTGLFANTAQNCYGQSSDDTGLYAVRSAIGCHGQTITGMRALYAGNAAFCTAVASGGPAIQATVANGCYAVGGTNSIVWKYNMP